MTDEPIRVVIVEDHVMVAEGIVALLESAPDIEVVGVAGTVEDGFRFVDSRQPHVALIDYRLPDGDGIELTRAIKARWADVQVVMVTGEEGPGLLNQAIDVGCSGFIGKGRDITMVIDAIRAAAQGEAVIPPDLLARLLPRLRGAETQFGADLTAREREVLQALALGRTTKQIADELFISVVTVRNHVQNVLSKLDAHSKLEAVTIALREGLVEAPARKR